MRAFITAICCAVLLSAGAIAQKQDTLKPRKKKQPAAQKTASPSVESPATASDPRVGTTKTGQVVYRGRKGGYYVLTPSGRKRYVKEADVLLDQPK